MADSEKAWEGEMFRLLVENVKDYAIFVVAPDRHVLSWSKGAEHVLGFTEAEIVGQKCDVFFTPEDVRRGVPQKEMEQAAATGRGDDDRWHVRKDGTRFWASGVVTPLRDDGGTLRGFAKIMRDRTELKRAEEQLREVESRRTARQAVTHILADAASVGEAAPLVLRAVCEALGWDVGALWAVDRAANVLRCVDVCRCGPAPTGGFEAATRNTVLPPNGSLPGRVWHADRPLWIPDVVHDPQFRRAAAAAEAGLHGGFAVPVRVGGEFLGVVEFFSRDIREPDPDLLEMMTTLGGQVGQFMERRRAEAALRESEALLRAVLDHTPALVYVVDADGRFLLVNRRWGDVFGLAQEQVAGRSLHDFFPPDVADQFRRNNRQVIEAGVPVEVEEVAPQADGTHTYISVKVPFLHGAGGPAVCGISTDITVRKQAEEELRASEGRFRGLMEQAPFSVQVLAPDGRTLRVNRAWEELWGLTLDRIADYNLLEDRQLEAKGILPVIRRAFAGEAVEIPAIGYDPNETLPDRTRHADPLRWVSAVAYPLKDEAGRVREVILVHQDITARMKAEEERRRSDERTRIVLESITDAFFAVDRDWRFTYVNPQAERILDRTPGDLLGRVLWDEYPGLAGSEFEQAYRRAAAERITVSVTAYYPDHDRWYKAHVYPAADGISIYFRDVSERKRARAELDRLTAAAEQQRRIYETALSNTADFNYVFDLRGRFVYVNRALLALWGKELHEAVGKDFFDLGYPPELAARLQRQIQAVIDTKQPVKDETPYTSGVGERQYEYIFVPVLAAHGSVEAVAGSTRDITDRKRAEEELRQSRGQLSAELAAMSRLHDLSNRLLACHDLRTALDEVLEAAVALLGSACGNVQLHDPRAGTLEIVAHRGFGPEFLDHFAVVRTDDEAACGRAMRSGRRVVIEDVQTDPAFEPYLAVAAAAGYRAVQSTPLLSRKGELLGMLSTHFRQPHRPDERDLRALDLYARQAADFIERIGVEEALREADRRKDEFLATLAHELRNPLAPIRNALQILKMPRVDAATVERARSMMERQVDQLVRLVDDLLDVSRVMRGKVALRKERVELATVAARAVETVQPLIDAQGHRLDVSLPAESLLLNADPVRLAQVVANLLTNAAKYTEPGGRIWLWAWREGGAAVLRVRDTGIGIAPDVLPQVFDLFVQVDHAATRSQGGLGIGLTLVKNLVEMHGGTVEAHSGGLGEGSEFVVRLPLVAPEDRDPGGDPAGGRQPVPTRQSGRRVMVVDDNRDAAVSLAMLLGLQGHEVTVAHDGPSALELAQSFRPAVVILDIGMPGMDGYEVARRLRRQPGLEGVVLAALTGWGQPEDRRRTAEAGFDHHLVKPPEPQAVEAVLAALPK